MRYVLSLIMLAATVFVLSGCSGTDESVAEPTTGEASPGEANRGARTLTIPGSGPPARDPAGGVAAGRLVWDVPEGWTPEAPSSSMRIAQYSVAGAKGSGECVVYYFGPGQGGDAASNAVRWARQFQQPDGSSSVDHMKVSPLDDTSVAVQIVEVTGTYDGGMTMTDAPAEQQTGYMLLGGIAEGPDANWFFKFTGPEPTVRAQYERFVGMMESLRPGA